MKKFIIAHNSGSSLYSKIVDTQKEVDDEIGEDGIYCDEKAIIFEVEGNFTIKTIDRT